MPEISWQVESFRATAFYDVGKTQFDASKLWSSLVHRQPDQLSSRPNEKIQIAQGRYGGNEKYIQCTTRPDRVDWTLQAPQAQANITPIGAPVMASPNLPVIGTIGASLPPFLELVERWLKMNPEVIRLAFGAVLMYEATDQNEANQKIATLLPTIDLGNSSSDSVSDLLFRINRKTVARIDGSEILVNRISTWSTVQIGSVGFAISGGGPVQVLGQSGSFACRLELDVNTANNLGHPSIQRDASSIFAKLAHYGQAIAMEGDKS